MQRSKLILPKITFTCNNISGFPTPRLVLFRSFIHSFVHSFTCILAKIHQSWRQKRRKEEGKGVAGDHQLEFRTQSVSILCLGNSGLCLPPAFLVSFPAMPLQMCYDPITLLPPTTGVVWPITFLHSHGGELWPLNPSVVSSPTITLAFLHPCLCSRSTHPHTKCLPCPSLGSRSSSPARTISTPVSNRWLFRTPSLRGNGFLF